MDSKWIIGISVAVFVSILIAIAPWAYTFGNSPFSTNPANWGVFGDYFGGVLSTIISIFGFAAVVATINLQSRGIKDQLAAIRRDEQARDDEVYNRQALQCLEEALRKLDDPITGKINDTKLGWLDSARLILTAGELADRIKSESMRTIYTASAKLIRSKFQVRLDPSTNQETLQPSYFSGPNWEDFYQNRATGGLEKHSVYIVYKFTSWDPDEADVLDSIIGKIDVARISKRYFGAVTYLSDEERNSRNPPPRRKKRPQGS